ncbi:MAG: protein kinase, partial [Cyanobacteria bacterium]|nr:protein kinase [Cyanobacteriota bacterium]
MHLSKHDSNISLDSVGQLLANRYSLVSLLGTGGMAKVFEAYDTILNRIVAVKIMNSGDFSEHRVVRFHRGAKAASAINHPNVATTLDFGLTTDSRPYMVMELVRGVTLRAIFKSAGAILPELALQIIEQVCNGMALAHKLGIVHRDLTPSNIIIEGLGTSQPRAKILDFGIAMITSEAKPITKQGCVVGSPVYMSPEQVQGKQLDTRTDVYSIGCLLFEALTGRPAFKGKTPLETMSLHVLEAPPTLKDHWKHYHGEYNPELDRVLAKALAKDPNKRYQSVTEMRADILACMLIKDEAPTEDFSPESFSLNERVTAAANPRRSLRLWISGLFLSGIVLMIAGVALAAYVLCQQPGRATQTSYAATSDEHLTQLFNAADDACFSRTETYRM